MYNGINNYWFNKLRTWNDILYKTENFILYNAASYWYFN